MNALYLLIGSLLLTGCSLNRLEGQPYSFCKEPFIHPRIVEELTTWCSDTGDQIISINLPDCQDSDRYHGDVEIFAVSNAYPIISCYENTTVPEAFFSYQYVGQTKSGIQVLKIQDSGGGSLVMEYFLLLSFERDRGIEYDETSHTVRGKGLINLKRIGEISGFLERNMEYVKSTTLSGNTLRIKTSDSFDPLYEGVYAIKINAGCL